MAADQRQVELTTWKTSNQKRRNLLKIERTYQASTNTSKCDVCGSTLHSANDCSSQRHTNV